MTKDMFTKMKSGLKLPDFDESIAKAIPTIVHRYNTPQPKSSEPFWMEFGKPIDPRLVDQGHGHGVIAFTRHTEKIYPDIVNAVYDYFMSVNPTFPWVKERIQLLRTSGYIVPHVDEPEVRKTSINIGLKNTNCAETKFSNIGSFIDIENTTNFIQEDGDVYMLDVGSIHSVHPIKPCDTRYLISYSMVRPYSVIKPLLVK